MKSPLVSIGHFDCDIQDLVQKCVQVLTVRLVPEHLHETRQYGWRAGRSAVNHVFASGQGPFVAAPRQTRVTREIKSVTPRPPDSRRSSRRRVRQPRCADARALRAAGTSCHRARGSDGAALNVPRPQLERQDDQRDAKYERKGTKPPGKNYRSGQGCQDHQNAEQQCRGAA